MIKVNELFSLQIFIYIIATLENVLYWSYLTTRYFIYKDLNISGFLLAVFSVVGSLEVVELSLVIWICASTSQEVGICIFLKNCS